MKPPSKFVFRSSQSNSDLTSDAVLSGVAMYLKSYNDIAKLNSLSDFITDREEDKPSLYAMFVVPVVAHSSGLSGEPPPEDRRIVRRFEQIEQQLSRLADPEQMDDQVVEQGALDTAKQVVSQLRTCHLRPPEISWLGTEAIVMLWVLHETKYAITITDGEVGYLVRRAKKTIKRRANIAVEQFDLLRLT